MPIFSQSRPVIQARVCMRSLAPARSVRVQVASPPSDDTKEDAPKGEQGYMTGAVQSVMQTERAKELKWKGNDFVGKIEHDEHHQRTNAPSEVAEEKTSKRPMLALPAPAELVVSFRQYIVGMLEKVASSKDADAVEPKWTTNDFKGRISHKHNGDHHGR